MTRTETPLSPGEVALLATVARSSMGVRLRETTPERTRLKDLGLIEVRSVAGGTIWKATAAGLDAHNRLTAGQMVTFRGAAKPPGRHGSHWRG